MTPKKLSHRVENITPFYVMELLQRAKQLQAQGRDIIHMEVGEPDFPTPPAIIKAGVEYLKTGQIKYTPAAGIPELREKIAAFYQSRYDLKVVPERILITPGASGALLVALAVSLNAGKEMLMADPCYPCNSNIVKLLHGKTRLIPVHAQCNYQLTAALIEQNWQQQTQAVLIASPSNPTGTIIEPEQLQRCITTVIGRGGEFYSDEIYHGLAYGKNTATALQYSDQVYVINSFSKYFGMTGWRIGWLVVPEYAIETAEKVMQNIFIATATHSQAAALAAFSEDNLLELENRRQELEKRRDFLYHHLQRLGFEISVKPEGAFYIYANCSTFTDDSFSFAQNLLEIAGVAITPGKDFGVNRAQQYVRFAYTNPINRLAEAVERLEKFIIKE